MQIRLIAISRVSNLCSCQPDDEGMNYTCACPLWRKIEYWTYDHEGD